jgi:hypothetical protein
MIKKNKKQLAGQQKATAARAYIEGTAAVGGNDVKP